MAAQIENTVTFIWMKNIEDAFKDTITYCRPYFEERLAYHAGEKTSSLDKYNTFNDLKQDAINKLNRQSSTDMQNPFLISIKYDDTKRILGINAEKIDENKFNDLKQKNSNLMVYAGRLNDFPPGEITAAIPGTGVVTFIWKGNVESAFKDTIEVCCRPFFEERLKYYAGQKITNLNEYNNLVDLRSDAKKKLNRGDVDSFPFLITIKYDKDKQILGINGEAIDDKKFADLKRDKKDVMVFAGKVDAFVPTPGVGIVPGPLIPAKTGTPFPLADTQKNLLTGAGTLEGPRKGETFEQRWYQLNDDIRKQLVTLSPDILKQLFEWDGKESVAEESYQLVPAVTGGNLNVHNSQVQKGGKFYPPDDEAYFKAKYLKYKSKYMYLKGNL